MSNPTSPKAVTRSPLFDAGLDEMLDSSVRGRSDTTTLEPGTSLFDEVASTDFLGFSFNNNSYSEKLAASARKTGLVCAVTVEVRQVGDDRVVWIRHHWGFLGGSLGCAEGEKICLGLELARLEGIPAVIECRSGGARMQEGTLSLMQMAKVSVAVQALKEAHIPFISVCEDPTYGGVSASYAMQGDVRIGVKGARIGFAGPEVILNTVYEMDTAKYDAEVPQGFQSAEYLCTHGQLDMVVETSQDVLPAVARVLKVLWNWRGQDLAPLPEVASIEPAPSDLEHDYTKSRSMERPQAQDIINSVFQDYVPLSGDGRVGDDACMSGGPALFCGRPCIVIATTKGHDPASMAESNYGMASPHGYRLAHRLFALAEKLQLPVFTLVDTPGAYPSFQSEADGQSEALATNLVTMAGMSVPLITLVVGEGGSGGALGIAMGNRIGMLANAYYSVISPEGGASILGSYSDEADKAARFPGDCRTLSNMQAVYADQLHSFGVIDEVLPEPADPSDPAVYQTIRSFFIRSLSQLAPLERQALVVDRYAKFRRMGKFARLTEEDRANAIAPAGTPPVTRKKAARRKPPRSPTLDFLADQTLNSAYSSHRGKAPAGLVATTPITNSAPAPTTRTAKNILDEEGPEAVAKWVASQKRVLVTDTTSRDAHQSLFATRARTVDILGGMREAATVLHDAFSFEVWGGATFDVAYRFLREDPWERLRAIRAAAPNTLLQMLLRGSNAVGYKSYPDNVIREFIRLAAKNGVDVFRIFDCFNSLEQMTVAIDAVRSAGKIAEVCLCFTGDFLDPSESIYTLDYYKNLAKSYVEAGAHMIAIKDMAGLLKPQQAAPLMAALKSVTDLPIHFHCHNTSSASLATALNMAHAGCDIIDFAIASMADTTSQPSLNAFCAAMTGTERDPAINWLALERLDLYWASVRALYSPFESGLKNGTARVYDHEIPGGQYSNLIVQCKSLGIWDKWDQVLDMYRDVDKLLGRVVKVTPSSKVVGDFALFLIAKGLSTEDIKKNPGAQDYPDSVVSLCRGELGSPHLGLPDWLVDAVLKGGAPLDARPGASLPPVDLEAEKARLGAKYMHPVSDEDVIAAVLYPAVYDEYVAWKVKYGPKTTYIPTHVYWYGMTIGQTITFNMPVDEHIGGAGTERLTVPHGGAVSTELAPLVITLKRIGPLREGSLRVLTFDVNGDTYEAHVTDSSVNTGRAPAGKPADGADPRQLGSPMPGNVEKLLVAVGDTVKAGQAIVIVSAMKMEVAVAAPHDGKVTELPIPAGERVDQGTLVAIVNES